MANFWQNYWQQSPNFTKDHEIFANVLSLAFAFVTTSLYYIEWHKILISEVGDVIFLCFVNTSDIFNLLLTLSFINLPFPFTEKNAGKNRWWKNVICKETNISVILVIIYFEIKSTIKREQRAVSFNSEYLLSSHPNF